MFKEPTILLLLITAVVVIFIIVFYIIYRKKVYYNLNEIKDDKRIKSFLNEISRHYNINGYTKRPVSEDVFINRIWFTNKRRKAVYSNSKNIKYLAISLSNTKEIIILLKDINTGEIIKYNYFTGKVEQFPF